ncbi:MAG: cofactor-independent phosphoglycerate mutase [Pirellula sp.]|jgi:2,3-bisphosphoglycerate-independent phosphoglycerate mutase|nr:cofactor-independent phosphoglycerate mutase [Pirellula sp.]
MKWVIIIPDGCADFPVESLGGKTPLQAANVPNMDRIAAAGVVGRSDNVPRVFTPGSEVANMTLFGYDPNVFFTGRAPIEAAAQGIKLGPYDWAIRCNLVTVENQIMVDFTADHISSEEAAEMLRTAQEKLGSSQLEFVPGVSYRNLLIYRGQSASDVPFSSDTRTTAPHDLTDESIEHDFPRGPGCELLCRLMEESEGVFKDHPVNQKRIAAGKKPATNLWLWGLGKTPQLPSFESLHGCRGAMITAVDLLRGLAALIGWDRIEVVGATGYLDTNYAGKGKAAIEALKSHDIVCVHIEATDEASHEGRVDEKIKALEAIDQHIVGPVLDALEKMGDYRVLVMPDHPTPVSTKKHSHGWVPFATCGKGIQSDSAKTYDEIAAGQSTLQYPDGWELIPSWMKADFPGKK